MNIENRLKTLINTPSDINEHLETLYNVAMRCESITEFGVRTGISTTAFLCTGKKLTAYDIDKNHEVALLFDVRKNDGFPVEYIIENTLNIVIEDTDFLFIDTEHTYSQLKLELKLHGNKAKKYIGFHDTQTFGVIGADGGLGLLPAIIEFLIENTEWRFYLHKTNNNGLTIIERWK